MASRQQWLRYKFFFLALFLAASGVFAAYSLYNDVQHPLSLWHHTVKRMGAIAREQPDQSQYWLWRYAQVLLLAAPLLVWAAWSRLNRVQMELDAIRQHELQATQRELAAKRLAEIEATTAQAEADDAILERARSAARDAYPDHLSVFDLEEDDWPYELIDELLDPSEIVIQVPLGGAERHAEIKLYDRRRVERARLDPRVMEARTKARIRRKMDEEEMKRWEEAERREEAMKAEKAAKEAEKASRQAAQKIMVFDDKDDAMVATSGPMALRCSQPL